MLLALALVLNLDLALRFPQVAAPPTVVATLEHAAAARPMPAELESRDPDGCAGAARVLRYKGSPIHRIAKGHIVQGGDVVSFNGSGCVSALDEGEPFADESFAVPHRRPGILSMANSGPNTNGCQFFVTLSAVPGCDGKHTAFGRLVGGLPLLRRIEGLTVDDDDAPIEPVLITDCGEVEASEAARCFPSVASAGGAPDEVTSFDVGSGEPVLILTLSPSPHPRQVTGIDMGGEALLKAASEGDLRLMRQLIERGVPVDGFGCVEPCLNLDPTSA